MPGFLLLGATSDIAADLARRLHAAGHATLLAARDSGRLGDLAGDLGAETVECDALDGDAVVAAFKASQGTVRRRASPGRRTCAGPS